MIKGLHHAAISVRNLDRSIGFYCGVVGMQLLRRGSFLGEPMDGITGLTATSGRSAMLRAGAQYIELFEFAAPSPKGSDRRVCDYGISHFCIEVTNVQIEYERLKAAGVKFTCPPRSFGDMHATYARDPDGNVFELLDMLQSR